MDVNPIFSERNFTARRDLCFVLMPLREPFASIFKNHIKPVARKCGLEAVKADDITSNKAVIEDVWAYLNAARVVIADLTGSNPNVFYEMGIAHTLGKGVIIITQDPKVPFDVGHVRRIRYSYPSQVPLFEERLRDTITLVLSDSMLTGGADKRNGPEKHRHKLSEKEQIALSWRLIRFRRGHRSPNVFLSQTEKRQIISILRSVECLFPKRKKLARSTRRKVESLAQPVYRLIKDDIERLEQGLMTDTSGP